MAVVEEKFCSACGTKLTEKYLEGEGMVPYCETCRDFRFPVFNTAVSMIVRDEEDRILLIKQYGRDSYILVAGYINRGEDAEDAVAREISEEVDLPVKSISFNHSHYFEKSNTLMLNFTVRVGSSDVHANREVDAYQWFTAKEAQRHIRRPSLAAEFLDGYLSGEYHFS
jgi:NAD+ diphosphatase